MKKFTVIITCTLTDERKIEAKNKVAATVEAYSKLTEWGINDENAVITVIDDEEVAVEQAPPSDAPEKE